MKNLFKLFGIIALVAIIGFSFAACGNGTTDNNSDGDGEDTYNIKGSEWKADGMDITLIFNTNSTYECKMGESLWDSGSYTVSDNIISCDGEDEDLRTITIINENRIKDARANNPTYYDRVH